MLCLEPCLTLRSESQGIELFECVREPGERLALFLEVNDLITAFLMADQCLLSSYLLLSGGVRSG